MFYFVNLFLFFSVPNYLCFLASVPFWIEGLVFLACLLVCVVHSCLSPMFTALHYSSSRDKGTFVELLLSPACVLVPKTSQNITGLGCSGRLCVGLEGSGLVWKVFGCSGRFWVCLEGSGLVWRFLGSGFHLWFRDLHPRSFQDLLGCLTGPLTNDI